MTGRDMARHMPLVGLDGEGGDGLDAALPPPVFLHSSFRTSSTWLWSRLREAPTTFAYYEIFNESLGGLTPDTVSGASYEFWTSKHPPGAPYFLEFAPFLTREHAGVPGYVKAMAIERFIPSDGIGGALSAEEERYLAGLIGYARRQGRIPVLSDVRTLGRAPAIKRTLGGTHVLIVRNIFHQWASFSRQMHDGNPYFFHQMQSIARSSQHDPFIAMLDATLKKRKPETTDRAFLQFFILIHLYLYANNFDTADVVVDVNRICRDRAALATAEEDLGRAVGHPIDLSDVRNGFEVSFTDVGSRNSFGDLIDQFTKIIGGCFAQASPDRDAFVDAIKNDALAELDRNEFYCRGLRSLYLKSMASARDAAHSAQAPTKADGIAGAIPGRIDARSSSEAGADAASGRADEPPPDAYETGERAQDPGQADLPSDDLPSTAMQDDATTSDDNAPEPPPAPATPPALPNEASPGPVHQRKKVRSVATSRRKRELTAPDA